MQSKEYLQRTGQETEETVQLFRLQLYNRGVPCGAEAIAQQMRQECFSPIPSTRAIGRILAERKLTYGRTGYYKDEELPRGWKF